MSCEEIWSEFPNYIGGELSVGLRAAIEEHFKRCKHCIAALGGPGNVLRLVGDAAATNRSTLPGPPSAAIQCLQRPVNYV